MKTRIDVQTCGHLKSSWSDLYLLSFMWNICGNNQQVFQFKYFGKTMKLIFNSVSLIKLV